MFEVFSCPVNCSSNLDVSSDADICPEFMSRFGPGCTKLMMLESMCCFTKQ